MAKKAQPAEALLADMLALIQNPEVTSVKIDFGINGVNDAGSTVYSYRVSGRDAKDKEVASASVRAETSVFRELLDAALIGAKFKLTESYIDPRGGMQGDWLYERN